MAKKRRPARPTKKASAPRKAAKKKGTTKKTTRRVTAARSVIEPAAKSLNLKVLREQIALALKAMSTKVGATSATESHLDNTRRCLNQWMTDIDDICSPEDQEICGPTMDLPLP